MSETSATHGSSAHRPSDESQYFGALEQLTSRIYSYIPDYDSTAGQTQSTDVDLTVPQPDLVVMCSWMGAAPRHIAKYTSHYMTHRKSVPLILVRCSQVDAMIKTEANQVRDMQPAVTYMQSIFIGLGATPRVLMHVFSNGGSWSAFLLSTAYQKATGGLTLPISALVMDSCPSTPNLHRTHLALSAALPRNFVLRFVGSMILWVVIYLIKTFNQLGFSENLVLRVRRVLNAPQGPFIKSGIPRSYICSRTDKMVPYEDVRTHADDAETVMRRLGIDTEEARRRVVVEEFHGSPHVGHLMADADRYWAVVDHVWARGMRIRGDVKNVER